MDHGEGLVAIASGLVVKVVGGRGLVDVNQPIIVVYNEGVVEVGLRVEFDSLVVRLRGCEL